MRTCAGCCAVRRQAISADPVLEFVARDLSEVRITFHLAHLIHELASDQLGHAHLDSLNEDHVRYSTHR